jgi:hypothetical protein
MFVFCLLFAVFVTSCGFLENFTRLGCDCETPSDVSSMDLVQEESEDMPRTEQEESKVLENDVPRTELVQEVQKYDFIEGVSYTPSIPHVSSDSKNFGSGSKEYTQPASKFLSNDTGVQGAKLKIMMSKHREDIARLKRRTKMT